MGMPVGHVDPTKIYIKIPENPFLRKTIDQVAKSVEKYGVAFESVSPIILINRKLAFAQKRKG
jgi:hypothetical protein